MDATVTFKDGTSHIYQGVPDGTAPDVVEAQALKDFGKPVASLSGGAPPQEAPQDTTSPRWDIPGDIGRAAQASAEAIPADLKAAAPSPQDIAAQEAANHSKYGTIGGTIADIADSGKRVLSLAKVPLDAAGVVASPVTGLIHGTLGSALSYITPTPEKDTTVHGVTYYADPKKAADQIIDSSMAGLGPEARAAGTVAAASEGAASKSAIHPVAMEAHQAGYTLPPQMISEKPGILANTLAGWSGKVKTAQAASAKNQEVTNALAAKSLGLPEDAELNDAAFKSIRADAGKAYEDVKTALPAVTADDQYLAQVANLARPGTEAAQELFPGIAKNPQITALQDELSAVKQYPTAAGIEVVKKLRSDASANLKAFDDPSKQALGNAQKRAANAIDDLIDRNLQQSGASADVIQAYRDGRVQIAKSYDVQGATNTATGDVDASKIAKLAAKGQPLSGELATIGRVASAFPKAMQARAKFGDVEPLSVLDIAGSVAGLAHGNPAVAGALLGRPIARKAILSDTAQNAMFRNSVDADAVAGEKAALPSGRNYLAKAGATNAFLADERNARSHSRQPAKHD